MLARRVIFAGMLAVLPLVTAADTYEIGNGDILKIAVAGQPDMTGEFTVDAAGMIAFPVLGGLKASGMTTQGLQKKLYTLLVDGYLKKPEVTVSVKQYRSQRVFVTGVLDRPGPYPLPGDRTLLSLIPDMGALREGVGHEVVIIRPPDAEGGSSDASVVSQPTGGLPNEVPGSQIIRVNLKELLSGNPAKNLELMAGDTIYFPPAANVYVTGQVLRPGPIRYQEGMTVLQALTLAGGTTEKGSQKVKIIRVVDGRQVEIRPKLTDILLPEDTIKVPERFF